ncbi:MAG: OmpH family outer membrane protein [Armatimonadetes bacterium]|nr:OmpH family outer membrane protein [Armatimonadota bacterium]
MNRIRKYLTLSALAGVFAVSMAPGAVVLAQTAPQPTIGVVDVKKAFDEYKETQKSNTEVDGLVAGFRTELDVRSKNKLLNDAELGELITLKKKDKLTDADQARIDALEKEQKKRDEEISAISNTTSPTEQQTARLRELRDLSNKNDAALRSLAEDYSNQVDKRKDELSNKITEDMKKAIAKVAQAKGIATVVDKIAVLYGGVDITDEVVKALNTP